MSAGQPMEILVDRARRRKRIRMIIFYNHKKKRKKEKRKADGFAFPTIPPFFGFSTKKHLPLHKGGVQALFH